MTEHISVTMVDHTGEVTDALDANVAKTLTALGLQAAGYAQLELENDPRRIDTGLLRNSIAFAIAGETPKVVKDGGMSGQSYQSNAKNKRGESIPITKGKYTGKMAKAEGEKAVYIGSNVQYAVYVEYGATHANGTEMKANHFLQNAIYKHKDEYKQMIEAGLRGEL